VLLYLGVGWLKEEFDAIGVPFEQRGARTDEYMAAMRELRGADKPTFEGRFVSFKDAYCRPQPLAKRVPLIVGGHSEAAARRAGRLGDGFFPARGAPKELFEIVWKTAREAGRDPRSVEITVSLPENLDDIPRLAELGVSRVLVPASPMAGLKQMISKPADVAKWADIVAKYA